MATSDRAPSAPQKTLTDRGWWDRAITTRHLAAYQAGRLVNQLVWHLQISLFFASRKNDRTVDEVLNRLLRNAYHLTEEPGSGLHAAIGAVRNRWRDDVECEAVADDIGAFEFPDELDVDVSRETYCKRMINDWVGPLKKSITKAHKRVLRDSRERWSFQLGERLDQAVRPPDAYRLMYRKPVRRDTDNQAGSKSEPGGITVMQSDHRATLSRSEESRRTLVNYRPKPGESPLEDLWFLEIPELCSKVGVDAAEVKGRVRMIKAPNGRPDFAALDELDRQISGQLAKPAQITSEEERNRWIYDECCKGTPYKEIRLALAKNKGWEPIRSLSGIKGAAQRYAERNGLERPRARQRGRPRKRN